MIESTLIRFVEQLAIQAGEAILEIYSREKTDVNVKEDGSPVTIADSISNNLIINGLRKQYPDIPALSEESVDSFPLQDPIEMYWLIDPLDGTKEFIAKNGEFTVNIALVDNGNVLFGVVYAPVLDLLYSAWRGNGAFRVENGKRHNIKVSEANSSSAWRVLGSRSHSSERFNSWIQQLDSVSCKSKGSSLKFCLIAEGVADLYPRLGPTSIWDTAAGHCILQEAGGSVQSLESGEELTYGYPFKLINPDFVAIGKRIPKFLKRNIKLDN